MDSQGRKQGTKPTLPNVLQLFELTCGVRRMIESGWTVLVPYMTPEQRNDKRDLATKTQVLRCRRNTGYISGGGGTTSGDGGKVTEFEGLVRPILQTSLHAFFKGSKVNGESALSH